VGCRVIRGVGPRAGTTISIRASPADPGSRDLLSDRVRRIRPPGVAQIGRTLIDVSDEGRLAVCLASGRAGAIGDHPRGMRGTPRPAPAAWGFALRDAAGRVIKAGGSAKSHAAIGRRSARGRIVKRGAATLPVALGRNVPGDRKRASLLEAVDAHHRARASASNSDVSCRGIARGWVGNDTYEWKYRRQENTAMSRYRAAQLSGRIRRSFALAGGMDRLYRRFACVNLSGRRRTASTCKAFGAGTLRTMYLYRPLGFNQAECTCAFGTYAAQPYLEVPDPTLTTTDGLRLTLVTRRTWQGKSKSMAAPAGGRSGI